MNTEHATIPLDDPLAEVSDLLLAQIQPPGAGLGASPTVALDGLAQALGHHRSTLVDYCTLALQPQLSDADADRLGAILQQATDDSALSFWIDEVDCWVAEQLDLLPQDALSQQQSKLRRLIGQTWVDALWNDLQHRTKALQAYLQRVGVYSGPIDGIMGPTTQHAVESLRATYPNDLPLGSLGG